jgi:hypothetical protein
MNNPERRILTLEQVLMHTDQVLSILSTFHNIDRTRTSKSTQEQVRTILTSIFNIPYQLVLCFTSTLDIFYIPFRLSDIFNILDFRHFNILDFRYLDILDF